MNPPPPPGTESSIWLWKTHRPPRRILWGALTVAPLVNVVLLLFLFFLVNSAFVLQPGIVLQLPESSFAAGASYRDLVVAISSDNLMFYNDERITLDALPELFAREVAGNPSVGLLIEADSQVKHGTLVRLYNLAHAAGIQKVVLATDPPPD